MRHSLGRPSRSDFVQFEVSRRTINRDIEDLCKAGIPIVTKQGVNGGISIIENYKLDKTLFTPGEMQDILAGLRSLDSVNGTNRYGQLMEKLSVGSSDFMVGNQSVLIDLSSWYKDSLAPKIDLIRTAIDKCRELEFVYYSPKGESVRHIEPYYLIFRWSSWYVWGCKVSDRDMSGTDRSGMERSLKDGDFRLFKLNRMEDVKISEKEFSRRQVPMPDLSNEKIFPGGIKVKALFEKDCKWRLVEEFGPECFSEQHDGRLLFHADYTDKENLITWLLSFKEKVELLEPEDIREEMLNIAKKIQKLYL